MNCVKTSSPPALVTLDAWVRSRHTFGKSMTFLALEVEPGGDETQCLVSGERYGLGATAAGSFAKLCYPGSRVRVCGSVEAGRRGWPVLIAEERGVILRAAPTDAAVLRVHQQCKAGCLSVKEAVAALVIPVGGSGREDSIAAALAAAFLAAACLAGGNGRNTGPGGPPRVGKVAEMAGDEEATRRAAAVFSTNRRSIVASLRRHAPALALGASQGGAHRLLSAARRLAELGLGELAEDGGVCRAAAILRGREADVAAAVRGEGGAPRVATTSVAVATSAATSCEEGVTCVATTSLSVATSATTVAAASGAASTAAMPEAPGGQQVMGHEALSEAAAVAVGTAAKVLRRQPQLVVVEGEVQGRRPLDGGFCILDLKEQRGGGASGAAIRHVCVLHKGLDGGTAGQYADVAWPGAVLRFVGLPGLPGLPGDDVVATPGASSSATAAAAVASTQQRVLVVYGTRLLSASPVPKAVGATLRSIVEGGLDPKEGIAALGGLPGERHAEAWHDGAESAHREGDAARRGDGGDCGGTGTENEDDAGEGGGAATRRPPADSLVRRREKYLQDLATDTASARRWRISELVRRLQVQKPRRHEEQKRGPTTNDDDGSLRHRHTNTNAAMSSEGTTHGGGGGCVRVCGESVDGLDLDALAAFGPLRRRYPIKRRTVQCHDGNGTGGGEGGGTGECVGRGRGGDGIVGDSGEGSGGSGDGDGEGGSGRGVGGGSGGGGEGSGSGSGSGDGGNSCSHSISTSTHHTQHPPHRRAAGVLSLGQDGSFWQRSKRPQLIFMADTVERLLRSHPKWEARAKTEGRTEGDTRGGGVKKAGRGGSKAMFHLLDIGGSKGLLSQYLAERFGPEVLQVTVVDIDPESIEAAAVRAGRRGGLSNLSFIAGDASEVLAKARRGERRGGEKGTGVGGNEEAVICAGTVSLGPVDIVVGLHACGGLSDFSMAHAIAQGAAFAVCTCCYMSNPHIEVPCSTATERATDEATGGVTGGVTGGKKERGDPAGEGGGGGRTCMPSSVPSSVSSSLSSMGRNAWLVTATADLGSTTRDTISSAEIQVALRAAEKQSDPTIATLGAHSMNALRESLRMPVI